MKIRIKSFNGELPEYLTAGRIYDVVKMPDSMHRVVINDNNGNRMSTNLYKSGYLNGGSWEIVDETTDNMADIKYHVSPLTKVSCHHQWVSADSIGDTEHQYFCAYCGEKKTEAFGATNEV